MECLALMNYKSNMVLFLHTIYLILAGILQIKIHFISFQLRFGDTDTSFPQPSVSAVFDIRWRNGLQDLFRLSVGFGESPRASKYSLFV